MWNRRPAFLVLAALIVTAVFVGVRDREISPSVVARCVHLHADHLPDYRQRRNWLKQHGRSLMLGL